MNKKERNAGEGKKLTVYYDPCTSSRMDPNWLSFKKVRKKPVIVEAFKMDYPFSIETPEGKMWGDKGYYLVKGVKGEFYPCKPDIFEETYEEVDEQFQS